VSGTFVLEINDITWIKNNFIFQFITTNGLQLKEVGDFETQNFQPHKTLYEL
jgi:hypothetical protein